MNEKEEECVFCSSSINSQYVHTGMWALIDKGAKKVQMS